MEYQIKWLEEYKRFIDTNGKVFRYAKDGKRIVECKQTKKHNGYCYVHLIIGGKDKFLLTHRLVALAFIPNLENKPHVDHINRITDDNIVENLRWVTHKENMLNKSNNIIEMKEWLKTHNTYEDKSEYQRMRYELRKKAS